MGLPVGSPTKPYWHKLSHNLSCHRSTADVPSLQDVVIIGAGFAGAACAYYLSKAPNPPASITLLEAREACSGATGRNGGHLRPEALATFAKFADKIGASHADEIARFEVANAEALGELIEELKIDCDFERVGSANVYLDENLAKAAEEQHKSLREQGFDVVEKYQYHDAAVAECITGVPGSKGAMTFPAACLWPYKLVMHLLAAAVQKDVNLQTHTPVLKVSSEPDANGYWSISTARGLTTAKTVIFATNGYTRQLLPEYTGSIIPVRGICSHIRAASSEEVMPTLSHSVRTMGLKYSPGCQDYLVSRADGSIVVGGAWKVVRPGPKEDWHDVTDDSKLVPAAETYYDGFMERTFDSWKNVESQVDHLWTGIMGYTSDSLPHVGQVTEAKPGLFVCAGFNGHGMPQVLLCAKGVVKLVLESCEFAETGVPEAFRTGVHRQY